jgi:hypothetical protein
MCREVCTKVTEKKGKMLGTAEEPIQIDEARFEGNVNTIAADFCRVIAHHNRKIVMRL